MIKYIPDEIYKRLLEDLKTRALGGSAEAILIELLTRTGMRQEELYNLKRQDACFMDSTIRIEMAAKGSNKRVIPVNEEYAARLNKALESLGGEDRIVNILGSDAKSKCASVKRRLYNAFKVIMLKLEYKYARYSPHALRHTFAIRLYKATKDVLQVKYALGHRALDSTMIYVEFVTFESAAPNILLATG